MLALLVHLDLPFDPAVCSGVVTVGGVVVVLFVLLCLLFFIFTFSWELWPLKASTNPSFVYPPRSWPPGRSKW